MRFFGRGATVLRMTRKIITFVPANHHAMHHYWVYFMSNRRGNVLYTGVTNDLERRVREHRSGTVPGFTQKYRCHCLLYYEEYRDVRLAIAREKQLKGWLREKKERLIDTLNPDRVDLAADWE
jgi:putative endonuclease